MIEEKNENSNRKILVIVLVILAFAVILFVAFTPSHAILSKDVLSSNSIKIKVANDSTAPAATYIKDQLNSLATTDTGELAYDGTDDNNLRYIGKNPNNYITFNGELWRIVGVFNNVVNGTSKESRVKLVRTTKIDNATFNTNGTNDYSSSTLATYLNNDYLKTINTDSLNYIDSVTWNTSGKDLNDPNTIISFYKANSIYEGSNTEFNGIVGLINASDYGYSTSGGTTSDRNACINASMFTWNLSSDCFTNSYLYNAQSPLLTLTPRSDVNTSLFGIDVSGNLSSINIADSASSYSIYPAVYLKSDVTVASGTGTSADPFILK